MAGERGQRLDRWLWFARIVKTRTLAARLVSNGKIRINRERVTRQSRLVREGDVITAAIQERVLVLKVLLPGQRRGPAVEAQMLYDDISPPAPPRAKRLNFTAAAALRDKGSGRPTKRDRRRINALMERASKSND